MWLSTPAGPSPTGRATWARATGAGARAALPQSGHEFHAMVELSAAARAGAPRPPDRISDDFLPQIKTRGRQAP
jgi:hypothetical protein